MDDFELTEYSLWLQLRIYTTQAQYVKENSEDKQIPIVVSLAN